MGLRDQVKSQIESRENGAVFLDAPGLYKIEVLTAGYFESKVNKQQYWKLSGVIVEREPEPPEGVVVDKYSPLEVGTEVVVIHNLLKDRWGYSLKEREDIARAIDAGEDWDVSGKRLVVEIWMKKTDKNRDINVRSWMKIPQALADSSDEMPF